jgi:hypothetical protein
MYKRFSVFSLNGFIDPAGGQHFALRHRNYIYDDGAFDPQANDRFHDEFNLEATSHPTL